MNAEEPTHALRTPPQACDCAIHIYDAAAPLAPGPVNPGPAWATVETYRTLQRALGTTRTVVVQPTAYGLDNSVTMAAVDALGSDDARAVVTVDSTIAESEIAKLHAGGARGARFQMLPGGALGWEEILPVAERIAAFGWHLQVQLDGRTLPEREALLGSLPCPLVIDHVGKFLEPVPTDHPGVVSLRRLLATGRCWLKLSAAYEVSRSGPPHYEDVGAIARLAIVDAPERMLWATNWPHVSRPDNPPSDPEQLDLLRRWTGEARLFERILAENPARLYFA